MVIFNTAEDESASEKICQHAPEGVPAVAVSLNLQLELAGMDDAERDEFCQEMGVAVHDRDVLLREIMVASGQMRLLHSRRKRGANLDDPHRCNGR